MTTPSGELPDSNYYSLMEPSVNHRLPQYTTGVLAMTVGVACVDIFTGAKDGLKPICGAAYCLG